jgi:hypothetical protein
VRFRRRHEPEPVTRARHKLERVAPERHEPEPPIFATLLAGADHDTQTAVLHVLIAAHLRDARLVKEHQAELVALNGAHAWVCSCGKEGKPGSRAKVSVALDRHLSAAYLAMVEDERAALTPEAVV